MKKQVGFWLSLESYTWSVIGRVAPTLPYFGMGLVILVMGASLLSAKTSLAGVGSLREASIKAAGIGDYATAQALWNVHQLQITNDKLVRGAESEVEDLIFPERVVEREIEEYESLLEQYPGHRDIYWTLAQLYQRVSPEQARIYWEKARQLDPNNEMFE